MARLRDLYPDPTKDFEGFKAIITQVQENRLIPITPKREAKKAQSKARKNAPARISKGVKILNNLPEDELQKMIEKLKRSRG